MCKEIDKMNHSEASDEEMPEYIEEFQEDTFEESWIDGTSFEEMEKRLLYTKGVPCLRMELEPLIQHLHIMKYDPDEYTPLELTTKYKNDGDYYLETNNYGLAVLCYNEAIKSKCSDIDILLNIYTQRSIANSLLKNEEICL